MSETIDPKTQEIRCRRLGHPLTMDYCLREGGEGQPCRLVRDCWWERVDIETVLHQHLSDEEIEALEKRRETPPDKMSSLLDIIEAAKQRREASGDDSSESEK